MKRKILPGTVALILGWALIGIANPGSRTPVDKPNLRAVLWWFPEDTETLWVSNGPFEVKPAKSDKIGKPDHRFAVNDLHWTFSSFQAAEFAPRLEGRTLDFTMEAGRNFRPPAGFGLMPFEGATVLALRPRPDQSVDALDKLFSPGADKNYSLAGHKIHLFKRKREHDIWTLYVACPMPNVVIIVTNEKFLISMLYRMRYRRAGRALPATLPEWQHIDLDRGLWAVRHFYPVRGQRDPSSPYGRAKFDEPTGDNQAQGVIFKFDPRSSSQATVIFLSPNKNALKISKSWWHRPEEKLSPTISQPAKGIVQVTSQLGNNVSTPMFIFMLMGTFGHAIYL